MSSWADELFQRIESGGATAINELISRNTTEELFLDYKNISTASAAGGLDGEDRKNLSKAISGFGNSEGGVIIWGLDCRRDQQTGKETVSAKNLITDPSWFKALIDTAQGALTSPAHRLVRSVSVPTEASTGKGVVATLIPTALDAPLQANSGLGLYYIRAGSSFLPVPHALMAGMFGRRPSPELKIAVRPHSPQIQKGDPAPSVKFDVEIVNDGRGHADDLYLAIEKRDQNSVKIGFSYTEGGKWESYTSRSETVWVTKPAFHRLVPGTSIAVPVTITVSMTSATAGPISLLIRCGSTNAAGGVATLKLTTTDCERIYDNLRHDWTNRPDLWEAASANVLKRLYASFQSH